MIIRKYQSSDCKALTDLFYHTVHTISLVAVQNHKITGFGDIDKTGYLDRLYVHKDYQNQGIASAICDRLEQAFPVDKIISHVSITAKPFFLSRGYYVMEKNIKGSPASM